MVARAVGGGRIQHISKIWLTLAIHAMFEGKLLNGTPKRAVDRHTISLA